MLYKGTTIKGTISKQTTVTAIDLLFQQLSLQEKVGQMPQIMIAGIAEISLFKIQNLFKRNTAQIANTGSQSRKEIVPKYVTDLYTSITSCNQVIEYLSEIRVIVSTRQRLLATFNQTILKLLGYTSSGKERMVFLINIGDEEAYVLNA